jgi:hypothetical protein
MISTLTHARPPQLEVVAFRTKTTEKFQPHAEGGSGGYGAAAVADTGAYGQGTGYEQQAYGYGGEGGYGATETATGAAQGAYGTAQTDYTTAAYSQVSPPPLAPSTGPALRQQNNDASPSYY